MKKYKLIKKYPGSPELYTVLPKDSTICGNTFHDRKENPDRLWIENFPEYWQELNPECEIMSFKGITTKDIQEEGAFVFDTSRQEFNDGRDTVQFLTRRFGIESVKRKRDGEVFKLGDYVIGSDAKPYKIKSLSILGGYFFTNEDSIDAIVKTELFCVTNDGVKIFIGDVYYTPQRIGKGYAGVLGTVAGNGHISDLTNTFSTLEKAEEFILFNKECLSLQEVFKIYPQFKNKDTVTMHAEKLINLVKSKQ